jgi:hypothetical protein
MVLKAASIAAGIGVVFLLSTGLTSFAQAIAKVLVYSLLCLAIFTLSKDPWLACSIISTRIIVLAISVLYIVPFLDAETGTDAQMYHAVGIQVSHSIMGGGVIPDSGEGWGTSFYAIFTGIWYALSGVSQLGIMIFNSLIGAIGSLMFYRTLVENYGEPNRVLKYLIIFDPSVVYWSSIHGKDPCIFFFLGLLFRSLSRLFRSGGYKPLGLYLLSLAGMFIIRPQTALLCALAVLITLLILRLRSPILDPAIRLCFRLSAAAVAVSALVVFVFYGSVAEAAGPGLLEKLSAVLSGVSYGGTAIDVPTFYSWIDLLVYLPVGMIVVLFRPFPWEQGNTFIRLAGLDQLPLSAAFLLIAWGVMKHFRVFFTKVGRGAKGTFLDPLRIFLLVYCLGFVLMFAVITGNVGTLVRERIQVATFAWGAAFAMNAFLIRSARVGHIVSKVSQGSPVREF